ncbi:MAG: hypothetical protein BWY78_01199 [Alphaproteobacteria bacterium ADurb.Bin438]|nr:MAG: hypothetical protein BWY78_01199 [Alphaproteobacteria bacterium ADurb.Bin438]
MSGISPLFITILFISFEIPSKNNKGFIRDSHKKLPAAFIFALLIPLTISSVNGKNIKIAK